MKTGASYLETMFVADAMSPEVITLPAFTTMAEAASLFAKHEISGAPVVDDAGRCIGVLSTADFASLEQSGTLSRYQVGLSDEFTLAKHSNTEPFHIEHVAPDSVRQYMSRAVQTIEAQQSLFDAANYLLGEHIHHLIVLGSSGRPVGILSSLDILAALVGQQRQKGAAQ